MAATIILGGRSFVVRPLTIGQIREIGLLTVQVPSADPVESEKAHYDRIVAVLTAALAKADPPVAADAVTEIESTFPEMIAAYRAILELAGFVSPGEAKAAAASTGATSTDA